MVHYIIVLAVLHGGQWGTMQSETTFRKQEVCQLVGQQLTQKNDKIKAFKCIKRTNV